MSRIMVSTPEQAMCARLHTAALTRANRSRVHLAGASRTSIPPGHPMVIRSPFVASSARMKIVAGSRESGSSGSTVAILARSPTSIRSSPRRFQTGSGSRLMEDASLRSLSCGDNVMLCSSSPSARRARQGTHARSHHGSRTARIARTSPDGKLVLSVACPRVRRVPPTSTGSIPTARASPTHPSTADKQYLD